MWVDVAVDVGPGVGVLVTVGVHCVGVGPSVAVGGSVAVVTTGVADGVPVGVAGLAVGRLLGANASAAIPRQ